MRPKHFSVTSRGMSVDNIPLALYQTFGFIPWNLVLPFGREWSLSFGTEPARWGWGSGISYWMQPGLWDAVFPSRATSLLTETNRSPFLSFYLSRTLGMGY